MQVTDIGIDRAGFRGDTKRRFGRIDRAWISRRPR
jgi:hypothetical protein